MLFLKEFSNGVVSLGDTITLRSSQYKLERYSAYQKTTTKKKKLETKQKFSSSLPLSLLKKLLRLVFLFRQSLSRSVSSPVGEQADPTLLKFLITHICFVIMDVRENLQPGVRAILLKEDSIENFGDSVLITNLCSLCAPYS